MTSVTVASNLRQRFSNSETLYGFWLSTSSPETLDVMCASAADYIGIDCQHGTIDEAGIPMLLRTANTTPRLVRVSTKSPRAIGRVLDGGADGLVVPMVNDAIEAAAIVDAVRYPPLGSRSYGPSATYLPHDPLGLQRHPVVLAMIETESGLKNVDEILAVGGIDGVYVGVADLGISLGLSHVQSPPSEELIRPLRRIAEAAEAAGKIPAVHVGSGKFAFRFSKLGYRMITLGSDRAILRHGITSELQQARNSLQSSIDGVEASY